jgi:hypothetical protein
MSAPSLAGIVAALGGELYDGGRRASVPAPGHGPADRSASLRLVDGRLLIHGFGRTGWREIRDDLEARGLWPGSGAPPAEAGGAALRPDRRARVAAARALWDGLAPLGGDGPAAARLRLRGIELDPVRLHDLRTGRVPVSVYRPDGRVRPALVAGIRAGEALTAVEIAYLGPDGGEPRGMRLARKTVGVLPAGCAARLAPAAGAMLVAEGVFTTLSAMVRFGRPGWALFAAHNLARWTPPEGVRDVLVCGDRGAAGERAARTLAARLTAMGVAARVRLPPPGYGDWNDLTRRDGRGGGRAAGGVGEGGE